MSAPARRGQTLAEWTRFSALTKERQEEALRSCREAADSIYPGLDLTAEIRTIRAQGLGDTVLVEGAGGIAAFVSNKDQSPKPAAACASSNLARSATAGSRAGFSPAHGSVRSFGMPNVLAGMNMGRHEAHRLLVARY